MASKAKGTTKRLRLAVPRSQTGLGDDTGSSSSESGSSSSWSEEEDEDDIRALNRAKHGKRAAVAVDGEGVEDLAAGASEKTKKRKRRAVSPTAFGQSLSTLLAESSKGPTTSSATSRQTERQARREEERRKLQTESKHARLERGHVVDVIGGWGPRPARPFSEWAVASGLTAENELVGGGAAAEKALKRVAQKGVVKLFNAIRAAQGAADDEKQRRLSGAQRRKMAKTEPKPLPSVALAAPNGDGAVSRRQPNALGSIGQNQALANLSKASFLELIKAGGR